jgi:hypothetical protein
VCCFNKIEVPLKGAIRGLKMNYHKSIPKVRDAIQLQKCCLEGSFPTPHVMPKTNIGVITHHESRKSKELLPPSPNEFPETHPIRPRELIRAPLTPLTLIFTYLVVNIGKKSSTVVLSSPCNSHLCF